jgi:hypothetical protein
MLGHGSLLPGGDKDVAALHPLPQDRVWHNPPADKPYYRFPSYVNDLPPISHYFSVADVSDGKRDGTWRGMTISKEANGFDTPARLPYQSRVIEEVIKREGFGKDRVPDLFFVNYKLIDEVGHIWNMNSPEMRDTIRVQDRQLSKLVEFLDRQVGQKRWAMLVTADHGHTPDPRVSGGVRIWPLAVVENVNTRFDRNSNGVDIAQKRYMQPSGLYLDLDELHRNGYTLDDVARYLQSLTISDMATPDSNVSPGHGDDPAFQAVFPSHLLSELPCLAAGSG